MSQRRGHSPARCATLLRPAHLRPARPAPAPCRRCNGCIAIQPCLSPSPGHNTLRCIVIRCPSATSLLQYTPDHNTVIVLQYNSNSLLSRLLQYNAIKLHTQAAIQFFYCNTIPSQLHPSLAIQLQYNFFSLTAALYCNTPLCPAIQSSPPSLLQYNSCNTIPLKPAIIQPHQVKIQWMYRDPVLMSQRGSSPANFAPIFFFFRFSLLLLLLLLFFFSFLLATGRHKKYIYLYIFFSFSKILK